MDKNIKTIVIASGGTGGHLYPAIEVGDKLINNGFRTIFFLDKRVKDLIGEKQKVFIKAGSPFKLGFLSKLNNITNLIIGFFQSLYFLSKNKVDLVIGFGGYLSVPVIIAAWFLKLPVIIHEQNAILGRANNFCLFFSNKIALSFKRTCKLTKSNKIVHTGNPVRLKISDVGLKKFIFPKNKNFNILIIGGSQGAKIFSDVVPKALNLLPKELKDKIHIFQQVRKEDKIKVKNFYDEKKIKYNLNHFFTDIDKYYQIAHLVISRSGSSSIFEIAAAGRPSIIIPLSSALDNHQYKNAEFMLKNKAAFCIKEEKFNPVFLCENIKNLITNEKLLISLSVNARNQFVKNSAKLISDIAKKELDIIS